MSAILTSVGNAAQTASNATAAAASNAYRVPSIKAAVHSVGITFAALMAGFLVQATAEGATSSPTALLAYAKTHWLAFTVAQFVAPALRAYAATKNNPS